MTDRYQCVEPDIVTDDLNEGVWQAVLHLKNYYQASAFHVQVGLSCLPDIYEALEELDNLYLIDKPVLNAVREDVIVYGDVLARPNEGRYIIIRRKI